MSARKIKQAEPVLDIEFPQLLQDMIGDLTSAPEPVRHQAVLRRTPMLLEQWAAAVGDAIKKIPGVVDVLNGIENTISGPRHVLQRGPGGGRARRIFRRRKWNSTPAPFCKASRPRRRWW